MAIYDELEELRDRLVALVVVYPDFGIRVNDSIDLYSQAIVMPSDKLLAYIGHDMMNLYQYFREVYQNIDETRIQLKPIMALLEGLTEPV